MSNEHTAVNDIASETVDNLLNMADMVILDRRTQILNDDPNEAYLTSTIALHDRLVAMAREMVENFEVTDDGLRLSNEEVVWEEPEYTEVNWTRDLKIYQSLPDTWTTEDLAKSAKISKTTLDRILSGETTRPQSRTLRKIEQALGMDEGALDE